MLKLHPKCYRHLGKWYETTSKGEETMKQAHQTRGKPPTESSIGGDG